MSDTTPRDPGGRAHDTASNTVGKPPERWIEPTERLPLRWGTHRDRVLWGLILIAGGLIHLQAARAGAVWPLGVGSAAHAIGWLIMPARAWRRILPVFPSTLSLWLLLPGPGFSFILAIPFICWLLVRHRPWRSLVALGPVLLNGVVAAWLFTEYRWMPLSMAISALVLIGSAWWAWGLARPPARS